jgi:pimeloyl-ACP methyl ester carboxylesterase
MHACQSLFAGGRASAVHPESSRAADPARVAMGGTRLAPLPRPAWLPETVWPFRTEVLNCAGATIAVTDVGNGPTLLFVHTGLWSFIWRDLILRLAPDFRCVCFDMPGTGQSDRGSEMLTLHYASEVVTGLIEALDLTDVTLVVHDLGGPSGFAGAARVPQRIRGLAALNAFGWKPTGAALRFMLALMGSGVMREIDVLTRVVPRLSSNTFGAGRHMPESSRQAFLAGINAFGVKSFHSYMRSARDSDELYDEVSAALAGPFRRLPLLTVFGERNDPFGFQAHWKALYPDARQVVITKGNHFPMCDDPALVANVISTWHRQRVAPHLRSSG